MNDPGTAIDIIGRFVRLLLVNRLRLIARKPAMNAQQAFGIVAMFYAAVKPTTKSKQAAHR